jgi:hypothetical protein
MPSDADEVKTLGVRELPVREAMLGNITGIKCVRFPRRHVTGKTRYAY